MSKKEILLRAIRSGRKLSMQQQISLAVRLAVPAILAQLSTIACSYIDASMVGALGADATAAVGLVSTSIWLFGGICSSVASGFSVQVAHLFGANRIHEARDVVRQSLVTCLVISVVLCLIALIISHSLPVWLGGAENIRSAASSYFFIIGLMLPVLQISRLANSILRCSGNVLFPSIMGVVLCVLDVWFNYLLIPVYHTDGAALGTLLAEVITCTIVVIYLCFVSGKLKLTQDTDGRFLPTRRCLKKAFRISVPMGVEHSVFSAAQIAITAIIAPLGAVAIAANSFSVTAEAICYMFGYGISDAATTLVGQSIGARRHRLAFSLASISTFMGVIVMGVMGIVMYMTAPFIMHFLTPDLRVVTLGVECLRIESLAEPMFAASIVCYGVFVGAGDTLIPACMNLFSMWAVRLTLSLLLVGTMGLQGIWVAMCVELCFRGVIFLVRLYRKRWIRN